MAFLTMDTRKLKDNFDYLNKLFKRHHIKWTVVSKLLSGHKVYLAELLKLGVTQLSDSRISNIKALKSINPDIEAIYIKPPARRSLKNVVQYADISMNTEVRTIQLLSEEAKRQGKVHKVIIMIELGELREGVMRDKFVDFFQKTFSLDNIEVVGIGTNLSCLYGVLPTKDKLIQLSLYKELIEAKFNVRIPYVSGGSSVTIPLLQQKILPKGVNHFRVGESLFMGTDVYNDKPLDGLHTDVFRLTAEIIELTKKPRVPSGRMGTNVEGESYDFNDEDIGAKSYRAIIDLGLLDVDESHISPVDEEITIVGASSDMIVLDLGENDQNYKVGDLIEFHLDYMGMLRAMNSRYIEKRVVSPPR